MRKCSCESVGEALIVTPHQVDADTARLDDSRARYLIMTREANGLIWPDGSYTQVPSPRGIG